MQATALREAAETVGDKVTELAQEVGDVAHRVAAKTPWVDEPRPSRRMRGWLVGVLVLGAVAAIGWWLVARRKPTAYVGDEGTDQPSTQTGRHFAAVGT